MFWIFGDIRTKIRLCLHRVPKIQSHIDCWLISEDLADKVDTVSIEPSIFNRLQRDFNKDRNAWFVNKKLVKVTGTLLEN